MVLPKRKLVHLVLPKKTPPHFTVTTVGQWREWKKKHLIDFEKSARHDFLISEIHWSKQWNKIGIRWLMMGWCFLGRWMFPKIVGFPPKSSISIGFKPLFSPSILGAKNHIFWKHPDGEMGNGLLKKNHRSPDQVAGPQGCSCPTARGVSELIFEKNPGWCLGYFCGGGNTDPRLCGDDFINKLQGSLLNNQDSMENLLFKGFFIGVVVYVVGHVV